MKTTYIIPSITVLDYKLETYLDTLSQTPGTPGDETTKYRGDNLIPSISMDNDDDW